MGLAWWVASCADPAVVELRGPADELRLRVHVDVASTAEARRQGLTGRESLASDEGLLLLFPLEGEVCIANAFVPFAIDAVFANAAGQVVAVESAIPAEDDRPRCHTPIGQVLELPRGAALSVQVGDVLERRP